MSRANDTATVTLMQPLPRKGGDLSEVSLIKPNVGVLRGLRMINVLQMDVNTLSVLLPRITSPALLPEEVAALDPADFMALASRVVGFFMTPDAVEAAQAEMLN